MLFHWLDEVSRSDFATGSENSKLQCWGLVSAGPAGKRDLLRSPGINVRHHRELNGGPRSLTVRYPLRLCSPPLLCCKQRRAPYRKGLSFHPRWEKGENDSQLFISIQEHLWSTWFYQRLLNSRAANTTMLMTCQHTYSPWILGTDLASAVPHLNPLNPHSSACGDLGKSRIWLWHFKRPCHNDFPKAAWVTKSAIPAQVVVSFIQERELP